MCRSPIRCALALLLIILVQACGGGGGGGTTSGSSPSASNVSNPRVYGVAATGLAINGSVTLKDSTGATRTATISQPSGAFSIDVTGLTAPYFLQGEDSGGPTTLYSIATDAGNFNINPISNLVVVAAAMNIDPLAKTPDAVFNNPANFASLTPAQVQAATTSVMAQMSPAFQAALTANGASNVNPLTGLYQVGNGLDKVLDNFVVTLNSATGQVQELQVASNTTTVLGLVDMLGTFTAAGIYDGTVNTPAASGGLHSVNDVLITPAGEMRYVMDNGVLVIANLTVSGSQITGSGKAYAPTLNGQPTNFQFADGSKAINLTINGAIGTNSLSGTYTYGNYSDTFSFTLNTQQTSEQSSINKITGTYVSTSNSNTVFIGHIQADGTIWGSGPGIGYSGIIQVLDPNTNIYKVTLAYVQNGTYGYVTGLATFHDTAPVAASLSMPSALVPLGYTGDIANLSYSQSTSGNQGEFVMLLSNSSQQISIGAVRMSSQEQSIVAQPATNSLMVQGLATTAFSATATGNIQYSGSAASFTVQGSLNSQGNLNIVGNPGNITLNGATVSFAPASLATPLTGTGALTISSSSSSSTLPTGVIIVSSAAGTISSGLTITQPQSAVINWQGFSIGSSTTVSLTQSSLVPSVSPSTILGTLSSNGVVYAVVGNITVTGVLIGTDDEVISGGNVTLVSSP